MKPNRILLALALLLAILAAAGILHLFLIRFQAGELFPAYSSLRAGPLGTKAFYQGLEACPGILVERNYTPFDKVTLPHDATFLLLADTLQNSECHPRSVVNKIETFVHNGGRMVITLRPRHIVSRLEQEWDQLDTDENDDEDTQTDDTTASEVEATTQTVEAETEEQVQPRVRRTRKPAARPARPGPLPADDPAGDSNRVCLVKWLGAGVSEAGISNQTWATLSPEFTATDLPPRISCHTSLYFTNIAADATATNPITPAEPWRTVYARDDRALVIERRMGAGTLVLSALTYFTSNEAMKKERHPSLLAWIVGPHRRVIFDEAHLGVQESRGVATLARRYGLQGFAAGLLLLMILFIWRNSTSLVPAHDQGHPETDVVSVGRESEAGLSNLLRRSLSTPRLLGACLEEWRKNRPHRPAGLDQEIEEICREAMAASSKSELKSSVPKAYNRICQTLKDNRNKPRSPS